jgi:hypothetical protein
MDRKAFDRLKGLYREAVAEIERLKQLSVGVVCLAVPDSCYTCAWFSGRVCMRHRSPRHGQEINDPRKLVCGYYLRTRHPVTEIIAAVGEPENASRGTERPAPGSYARCDSCGHTIKVTAAGRLFRHDRNGKCLRGPGVGRNTPCAGNVASSDPAEELLTTAAGIGREDDEEENEELDGTET